MKKLDVLEIFYRSSLPLTPDQVRRRLWNYFVFTKRVSVYSYLLRLHQRGLLNRRFINGRIAYEISDRGITRYEYLRDREK
jgi:Fe2+ or Zn2+ uptake regulation protein